MLLLVSFLAGALTVLAPCVLPVLPVVLGSTIAGKTKATPYVVVGSLAVSIILFTYLLKISSAFIAVPQSFWSYFSGVILFFFGITLLFPSLWTKIPGVKALSEKSNRLTCAGFKKGGFLGDVLIGLSLGPIFSTCSPTFFVILATVIPASAFLGFLYVLAYVAGLSATLLLIGLLTEKISHKVSFLADPNGYFKKGLGVFFILFGILIFAGYEKKLETGLLNSGIFDVTKVEQMLLERTDLDKMQ